MRTCVLAVALFAAAGSVAAAPTETPSQAAPVKCPSAAPTLARDAAPAQNGAQRLDRLPQAVHQLTVLKSVGGCPVATLKVGRQTYEVPLPETRGFKPLDATMRMR